MRSSRQHETPVETLERLDHNLEDFSEVQDGEPYECRFPMCLDAGDACTEVSHGTRCMDRKGEGEDCVDPTCPCQDGDGAVCHYVDHTDAEGNVTKAWPRPRIAVDRAL